MDRCVQSWSAEEPKSMLLIESLFCLCFDFLVYPRARSFGVWIWNASEHICSHL
jgi:hypothetical protein